MRDLPAARWAADPYGRHELRFWDGAAWTAHVSDHGVTSHDLVPGVAAGQAAAHADEATAAMPVVVGAPDALAGGDDPTVAMPVVPPMPGAQEAHLAGPAGGAGLGTLFGGGPVPAQAPAAEPVAARPRTGLIAAVGGLAVIGLVAGIIGFNGLGGGSDGVVPLVAAPTTSAPTDPATETPSEDPAASETTYGGPTTSPAKRTTTTVKSTTTTPRTTSTTPTAKTTKPTRTRTTLPPTTVPAEFRRYPSCRAMNQDYPHGGGERVKDFYVSAPLYFINAQLDVDGDGIDCEA